MSRIGKKPIPIPKGVEVTIKGREITVKGPKGTLKRKFPSVLSVKIEDSQIVVERSREDKQVRSLHGTYRALINNMVEGVSKGFEKTLIIHGVGYKAQLTGKKLVINLGYSHPIEIEAPEGIEFEVERGIRIKVKGFDKELVGHVAAKIRRLRNPDPYKAKGVRYENEIIRRKPGKALAKGTGA